MDASTYISGLLWIAEFFGLRTVPSNISGFCNLHCPDCLLQFVKDVRRGYPEIMHTSPFQNFVHDTVFICPTMKCHISDRDRPATLMQMNASKSWHAGLLVCYCIEVGTWNTNIKVIHARALQNSDRYHHHYCCNWSLKAVQRLEKIGRALAVSANRTWNGYISLLLPLLWAIQLWIF